jgi:glucose dehydrogenase
MALLSNRHARMRACGLLLAVVGIACKPKVVEVGEWSHWGGGGKGFNRYAPYDQINASNVASMEIAWRRPAIDSVMKREQDSSQRESYLRMPREQWYLRLNAAQRRSQDSMAREFLAGRARRFGGYARAIPIIVDSTIYFANSRGLIDAVDPATGKILWSQQPRDTTQKERNGWQGMGMAYWTDSTKSDQRIIYIRNGFLSVLDLKTGKERMDFGDSGRVVLKQHDADFSWSGGPTVVRDVIVISGVLSSGGDGGHIRTAAPEDVRGFDVRTGKLLWTFHVVPQDGEVGTDTWGNNSWKGAGNLGQWGGIAGDDSLGYIYVPLSAPTGAYFGGHRPGNNLFANTIVAIDVTTGKLMWHFQTVHHDLWEYDLAAAPVLGSVQNGGKTRKILMQASKAGFVYVLDRVTGEPVWPIEERAVPKPFAPGEAASPTQPFPTKPAAFDRQGMTKEDLIDWPGFKEKALAKADSFVMGPIFTPAALIDSAKGMKGTLQVPGIWGAGSWNTGAFDPETGYYYAVSHTLPIVMGLKKTAANAKKYNFKTNKEEPADTSELIAYFSPWGTTKDTHIDSVPIFKPPWGRITAIDMNTGDRAWQVPNGDARWNHPELKALNLKELTGIPSRTVALVTKSLLFVGDGGTAAGSAHQSMWGKHMRAYDKKTGNVVWDKEFPGGLTGAPMSYMHRGIQYIVFPIGGQNVPGEYLVLRLPNGNK